MTSVLARTASGMYADRFLTGRRSPLLVLLPDVDGSMKLVNLTGEHLYGVEQATEREKKLVLTLLRAGRVER